MTKQADQVVKETYRYFYVDGLVETAVGLLFVGVGGMLLAWMALSTGSWLHVLAALALPLLTFGGGLIIKRVVQNLKERITYPRTGYVAYRDGQPGGGRWLIVGAALGLALLLFVVPAWLNKMPAVIGALLLVILVYMGYRVSLWRFYLFGAAALVLGVALAWLLADELLGAALTFIGVGAVMTVAGTAVFLNYLRRHPQADEAVA